MLTKLVINDWVHVSSRIVLEDSGRLVKEYVPIWGGFLLKGKFKYGKME